MKQHNQDARLLIAMLAAALAAPTFAEPVQLEQSAGKGSGYTFRRGNTCTVITAGHVVLDKDGLPAGDLVVLDRSGARVSGRVSYSNPSYDLALVTLPDGGEIACSATWPDASVLKSAQLGGDTRFEAVRHYPDGREALIMLSYAGGTNDKLSLAPVDKTGIRESDSGSIVMLGNRPAGIVLQIQTANDRVDVLRFDTIDQLVGERFRGSAGTNALAFTGVFLNDRENPAWTAYVRSWLTEQARWNVVPSEDPSASCLMQVNVMSWNWTSAVNPEFADAQEKAAKICERGGFLAEQLCKAANRDVQDTPRTLTSHNVMIEVGMKLRSGAVSSKLGTTQYAHDASMSNRSPEIELAVLQQAVSGIAQEMFGAGGCG